MSIRDARPDDAAAIARICLLTGARGGDATGVYGDDTFLADVYALPYLAGPGTFCLVWDVDGEARGYVLGAIDTRAFQRWFTDRWWPQVRPDHPVRTEDDARLARAAADPARMIVPGLDEFPAHLHIDLLSDQQGRGVGRALIDAACELLADRGVPGVHLVAERANVGAQAFYPRVGFVPLVADEAQVTFGRVLTRG